MDQRLEALPVYDHSMFKQWKLDGIKSAGAINKLFETEEDRLGLERWRAFYDKKHGEGACDKYMAECHDRGTMLHENIESWMLDKTLAQQDMGKYHKLWTVYRKDFLEDLEAVYMEKIVCSPALSMSGIIDCIGYYKGKLCVVDFKFASKAKDEQYITNYRRQVAVYALILYKEFGIKVDRCIIAIGSHKWIDAPEVQIFDYDASVLMKSLLKQLEDINYFTESVTKV